MAIVEEADWDSISALIDYTHRLLFRAALWRRLARPNAGPTVGSRSVSRISPATRSSSEGLDEHELSELLARVRAVGLRHRRREQRAHREDDRRRGDVRRRRRAMVAVIALALADRVAADPELPDVRVGVAYGSVLARDGDFYGPVVNLASRITGRARRGTVLASEPCTQALADDPEFAWRRLGTRRIRGIGEVAPLRAAPPLNPTANGDSAALGACDTVRGWPTTSVCSKSTPIPTTKRRRVRAPTPSTPPRASAACSCAAPAAKRATSSTRRSTRPRSARNLHEVRMEELARERRRDRVRELHMLGYRDSGMTDTEANARPDNFANAPLDEAVERLVRIIRAERPQVIITYGDDRKFYPHPDHVRVHEISGPAFDAAGDPDRFPDAGEPWQPSKLYYVGWSMARVKALHAAYIERGEESPFARWFEGENDDARPRRSLHHPHRRRRVPRRPPGRAARAPRPRSIPNGLLDGDSPTSSSARSSRGRTSSSRARSCRERCPEGELEDDLFAGPRANRARRAR